MNIYEDWGFKTNPFETKPLPANKKGAALMVGRDQATRKVAKGLSSSEKFLTVEGLNGVGKTSVVNVSVFKAAAEQIQSGSGPLFIPCRKVFQLSSTTSADDLKFEVLSEIAQTLIEAKNILPIPSGYSQTPTNQKLNRWLNSIEARSAGLNTPIGGLSYGAQPVATEGFNKSGFEKQVTDWLRLIFPSGQEGGVVCVIDNLELLQTSAAARELLERLRDDVLAIPGTRWVLCGALGIIEGVAASPRMAGYLQKPIKIDDLSPSFSKEIFEKRLDFFKQDVETFLPMGAHDFELLFQVMHGNLRAVLSECDNFCMYASDLQDEGRSIQSNTFNEWLDEQCKEAHDTSVQFVGKRAIEVFRVACEKEAFSPSDYEDFGCNSMAALRPQIKALEDAGLLQSTQDDGDKRRRTVQVVPKGWKVSHFLDIENDKATD